MFSMDFFVDCFKECCDFYILVLLVDMTCTQASKAGNANVHAIFAVHTAVPRVDLLHSPPPPRTHAYY